MAERRMFSKSIIDSDLFLDMPQSTQLLYFHLSMRADDDGFINNPKSIIRNVKCNEDDLKLLVAKQFVIPFENGIVVIKHWKIHNYIKSDRYKPTPYQDEKSQLYLENNIYVMSGTIVEPKRIQDGTEMDTQSKDRVRDSKDKIIDSKDTYCVELDKPDTTSPVIELILNDKTFYPITQEDVDEWSECFPEVDVMQELRKMKSWCNDNPTRRKTRKGIRKFISGWLGRRQNEGGVKNNGASAGTNTGDYSMSYQAWD